MRPPIRLFALLVSLLLSGAVLAKTADLQVSVRAPFAVDRGLPFLFDVDYRDRARNGADGVVVTVTVTGADLTGAPPECTIAGNSATCLIGTLVPDPFRTENQFRTLRFEARAPDVDHARMRVTATITGTDEEIDARTNTSNAEPRTYRTIFVTSTNDSGSGSLRAAIEEANTSSCENVIGGDRCKIGFRIAMNGAQWATIRPETPLPALTKQGVVIDGGTQTLLADTNPLGPEIEINGSHLTSGNGLTIAAVCGASTSHLVINGFPDNGVYLASPECDRGHSLAHHSSVGASYIGTDPTGTRAVPNLRGIFVAMEGQDAYAPASINSNVISGNRYSGVWVASGKSTVLNNNIIGLNAALTAGLGNGSSGVYITRGGGGTDLVDNYVGFNGHYGLALEAGTRNVQSKRNSYQANGNLAIDYGLDGVSPSIPDPQFARDNRLHAPVITAARFDSTANLTLIEGTIDVRREPAGCCRTFRVTLYANDEPDESGFGEGQYFLAEVFPTPDGRFTLEYRGRTPGRWIAAVSTSFHNTSVVSGPAPEYDYGVMTSATSEFSRTVRIE